MNCSAENQAWLCETTYGPYSFKLCLDTAMHDNMKLLIHPSGYEPFMFFFPGQHPHTSTDCYTYSKKLFTYMKANVLVPDIL